MIIKYKLLKFLKEISDWGIGAGCFGPYF